MSSGRGRWFKNDAAGSPCSIIFYSLFVPVVVSCLDIVIVIQEIQNPVHLLIASSSVNSTQVWGIIVTSASIIGIPSFSSASRTAEKSSGAVDYFIAVFLFCEIFCACIERQHHQFVRIHLALFFVDNNLALLIKHEGDASRRSDVSAALGKGASHIGSRTVFIIGQRIYDDSDAVRAVSFVCKVFIVYRVGISRRFLIPRSIVSFGMLFAFAFAITSRRRLLLAGSAPPSFTATAISRPITVKILPFAESFFSFCA